VVVDAGVTAKLAALVEVPISVPPEETVYHLILFPAEVAFNCDVEPHTTEAGVALTEVGVAGGVTVTTTAVLVELMQVPLIASA